MTVTTYADWVAAGSPWKASQPVADLGATLRAHGFTVYVIGNHSHATANPPEDHMPYSHTPWPGTQPYDYVLAMDVMPGGQMDWHELAQRLIADKDAGLPGARAIKYINWTDKSGKVWHTKWQPNKVTTASSDSGHIHISFRTDYVTSTELKNYNPLAFQPVSGSKPPSFKRIAEDGKLGPETIKRMEQYFGTPQDGRITNPSSVLKALAAHINKVTGRSVPLTGDPADFRQDGHSRSSLIGGTQCILHVTQDGYWSSPVSSGIKALQQRLNANNL